MDSSISALSSEFSSSSEITLSSLYQPIEEALTQTKDLYREMILNSAERNYLHNLIRGDGESFEPGVFNVDAADAIADHLLQSQGKWIRAALALHAVNINQPPDEPARQLAVAVELIHLATLVHDDIIDEAPMRRGQTSVSFGWGNSVAVLFGDFLLSRAFKLLLACESASAQTLMMRATGQVCMGEIKQLRPVDRSECTEDDYLETIENKTASLMAAATAAGGCLGELSEELVEYLHGYGHALGMVFQITDDLLDYTSSVNVMGKERGGDLRNGKVTLPLIHLLKHQPAAHSIINDDEPAEEKTRVLLTMMNDTGSVEYAYDAGRRYGGKAKEYLRAIERVLGASASLRSLYDLVDFVLARKR